MNKFLQIISILALLNIGWGKAEITPEELDKKFLKPIANLIIEDRDREIKNYTNFKISIKSRMFWDQKKLSQDEEAIKKFQKIKSEIEQKKASWFDKPSPELVKNFESVQEKVGDFETRLKKYKIVEEKLKEKKELLQSIQSKIENLEKEKKHPVSYMTTEVRYTTYFPIKVISLNEIKKVKQEAENELQSSIKSYNNEQKKIEETLINNKFGFQYLNAMEKRTYYLRHLLYRQMLVSELQLAVKAKDKKAFGELMQNYAEDIINRPEIYDQRVSLWTQRPSGTYYSMLEPEVGLTTYAPTWLSNAWSKVKEYAKPYVDAAKKYLETQKAQPISEPKLYERIASPKYPAFRGPMLRYKTTEELTRPTLEALRRFKEPSGESQ